MRDNVSFNGWGGEGGRGRHRNGVGARYLNDRST